MAIIDDVPGSIFINTGGGTYTDNLGQVWSADQLFTGGSTYSTTSAIANTTSDPLFQTERTGTNFSYAIPVANGSYEVDLGFAELYWNSANNRVFSVTAEGQTLLSNYDIWTDAGGANIAVIKKFTVNVTDGVLNLNFTASKDQAKVDFIQVTPTTLAPGVTPVQTGGSTTVTEGGATDSYSLVLNTQPTDNVTLTLNTGTQLTTSATTLTFTPTNWNVAQTVTVTAVDDFVVEGNHTGIITHTVTSTDPNYSGVTIAPITIAITDNDTNTVPGSIFINTGSGTYTDNLGQVWSADQLFTGGSTYSTTSAIANTTSDPLFQTERTGTNFSYAIPVANGSYEVDLGFAELYWNSANNRVFSVTAEGQTLLSNYDIWTDAGGANIAVIKKFTVNVTDGVLNLNFTASKDQAKVDFIQVTPTTLAPGVTPVQTGGSTTVTEGGATDSYSLVLNTQPTDNVTLTLNTGTQLTTSATTLTFTPTNWNVAQTVTVTAVDDFVVEGNHTGIITHTVTSTDPNYSEVTINPVNVSITDNDGAIRINVGGGAYTDTVGNIWQADSFFTGGSTYSITDPIFKTEDDPLYQSERSAANLSYQIPVANGNYLVKFHFAETYWDDFQKRVFDISIENNLAFDDVDIFAKSKNAFFPGKDSALVLSKPTVNVSDGLLNLDLLASVDNAKLSAIEIIPLEGPQVIFQETNGQTVVSEAGATDTYSVVLNTQPSADVTIKIGVDSQINTSKIALTFTSANWNIPQTVTVSAVNDILQEGTHFSSITHTVTSTDSSYSSLNLTALPVTVQDNDVVAISFTKKTVATNVDALGTYAKGATTGAWGPDGRLYVGTYSGEIKAYTFDDNYNVIAIQSITTMTGLYNKDILGIAFNPFDDPSGPIRIYVAHSQLYGNGGASFPVTEQSKYSGQVSILEGLNFSTVTPLITGLPVSNHDHGINGMDFDSAGNLYISVGSNTNAGIPDTALGGIPESPLTAAILKATVNKSNFNGAITYSLPSDFVPPDGLTFAPETSQVFGNIANIVPGNDVSVYASGFRNPYDVVWTTKGLLYATNNGSNTGFGDVSTSATTQKPYTGTDADELNLVIQDAYYGHPNRNRGQYDDRQNVFYSAFDNGIPGVVTAPLATISASTNGVTEYRAITFGGQLRGNLLAQQWNGSIYNFSISPDGQAVTKTEILDGISDGLDILTGPGGAIVGIDFSDNSITVALPNDVTAIGATAYDIFPWRAPAIGGSSFVIGGVNFGNLGDTSVTIGGQLAPLTSVSSNRITGIFPSLSVPVGNDLVDLVVQSGGQISTIPNAFLPLPVLA
ncbi:malectin domain-containing carbohydrate-binding protein [Nostoc sp. UHCC 0251]|uniref:malectin domain-containing carbohydrate-binding protein n=1 Tax=Nostoc sp. UHCC 0251 TaxID=3110240 RepID=UPI002B1F81A4|nr:malectin domain-containing carbohydrate-binding protein [Nostoc sp. UHCC 0251]MEA5624985.1 malectin domain-containing carbohydrate-binding protein [Nostoc sp. UHCC 0251]